MEMSRLDAGWQSVRPDWVTVTRLTDEHHRNALAWQQANLLGPGESEAMALAQQVRADWLLTDDAAARLVAGSVGLEVHGSLGVVLWAAAAGHLEKPDARATLEALIRSSLWMSSRVVEEARFALQRMFD
jgi:predicted nucleic acid-binding protein